MPNYSQLQAPELIQAAKKHWNDREMLHELREVLETRRGKLARKLLGEIDRRLQELEAVPRVEILLDQMFEAARRTTWWVQQARAIYSKGEGNEAKAALDKLEEAQPYHERFELLIEEVAAILSSMAAEETDEEVYEDNDLETSPIQWPNTEVHGIARTSLDTANFQTQSPLGYFEYRVGKTGDYEQERRNTLRYVFEADLPRLWPEEYLEQWGSPGSIERKQKMANTIASHVRNAKRNTTMELSTAIAEWEADLEWMKDAL